MLQLQNFKTKRKYIMILQTESKLHKNEKEQYSRCNNLHSNVRPVN